MSITLTTPASISINGSTVESDTDAAALYLEAVFPNSVRLFFRHGVMSAGQLAAGVNIQQVIVTIDLSSGNWNSTTGLSGTIGGAGLTNFRNQVKGWRNAAENFAVNNNIIVGTQVAW